MSKDHVEAVFGPEWLQERVADIEVRVAAWEKVGLGLRHALRCDDTTLPDPHDGTAWAPLEAEWYADLMNR